jgi:uroporphyrinogen decarboxylase
MNGNQRIKAALIGEWPDKRPIMLHNFMMAAREAGMTMEEYRSNPDNAARAHIEAVEKYDLDGVLIDFDTVTLAAAAGVPVDNPLDEPSRCSGAVINAIEKIDEMEPVDISRNERVQIWLETCKLVKNYFGNEIFVRGNCDQAPFSLASMIRSSEEWMMDLLLNEEYVFKVLEYSTDISGQFIHLMSETGVDMVSNGDSPAGPDLISPEMYRKYALSYEKEMAEIAYELKLPYLIHICGNTDDILKDMIQTGADAFELDYKTDINKIHEICKDKITLFGIIDPSGIMALGTPAQVEEEAKKLLDLYKDSPRFVMNAGCALPAFTPSENIERLVSITRNYP